MRSLLIRDTTRQEREEIVRRALSACGGSCPRAQARCGKACRPRARKGRVCGRKER
jgi:hypothetical protein